MRATTIHAPRDIRVSDVPDPSIKHFRIHATLRTDDLTNVVESHDVSGDHGRGYGDSGYGLQLDGHEQRGLDHDHRWCVWQRQR